MQVGDRVPVWGMGEAATVRHIEPVAESRDLLGDIVPAYRRVTLQFDNGQYVERREDELASPEE